jgi:hypothetical protein
LGPAPPHPAGPCQAGDADRSHAGISPFQAVPGKVLSDSSLRRYLRAGLETLTFRLEEAGTVIR